MDENTYQETYNNVKNGITQHDFIDLINWIKSDFGINVCNVIYDVVGPERMPRLNFILKNSSDLKNFSDKVGLYDHSKVSVFLEQHPLKSKYKTTNLFVISDSFESWVLYKLGLKAEILKQRISEENDAIWMVQQIHLIYIIFTYTDSQIESVKKKEALFHEEFFNELKKFDEFGFLNYEDITISFDSKKRFDTKFGGDWMRYFN